jgi:hypothetical protein
MRAVQKSGNSKSIINKDMASSEKMIDALVFPQFCSCDCPSPSFQVLPQAASRIAMPPSTRAKNANQHPGRILLANMKKRRTKEEIVADNKKKHLEKKTTEAALHRLYEYIAGEEDRLAEDEVNAHKKNLPQALPLHTQPLESLDDQNTPIICQWDSENECEVDANAEHWQGNSGKRTKAIS